MHDNERKAGGDMNRSGTFHTGFFRIRLILIALCLIGCGVLISADVENPLREESAGKGKEYLLPPIQVDSKVTLFASSPLSIRVPDVAYPKEFFDLLDSRLLKSDRALSFSEKLAKISLWQMETFRDEYLRSRQKPISDLWRIGPFLTKYRFPDSFAGQNDFRLPPATDAFDEKAVYYDLGVEKPLRWSKVDSALSAKPVGKAETGLYYFAFSIPAGEWEGKYLLIPKMAFSLTVNGNPCILSQVGDSFLLDLAEWKRVYPDLASGNDRLSFVVGMQIAPDFDYKKSMPALLDRKELDVILRFTAEKFFADCETKKPLNLSASQTKVELNSMNSLLKLLYQIHQDRESYDSLLKFALALQGRPLLYLQEAIWENLQNAVQKSPVAHRVRSQDYYRMNLAYAKILLARPDRETQNVIDYFKQIFGMEYLREENVKGYLALIDANKPYFEKSLPGVLLYVRRFLTLLDQNDRAGLTLFLGELNQVPAQKRDSFCNQFSNLPYQMRIHAREQGAVINSTGLDLDFDATRRQLSTLSRENSNAKICPFIRETLERSRCLFQKTSDPRLFDAAPPKYRELFQPYSEQYEAYLDDSLRLMQTKLGYTQEMVDRIRMVNSVKPIPILNVAPGKVPQEAIPNRKDWGLPLPYLQMKPTLTNLLCHEQSIRGSMNMQEVTEYYGFQPTDCLFPLADVVTSGEYRIVQNLEELVCMKNDKVLWRVMRKTSNFTNRGFWIRKDGVLRPHVAGSKVFARIFMEQGFLLTAFDLETGKELWLADRVNNPVEPTAAAKPLLNPVHYVNYVSDAIPWNGFLLAVKRMNPKPEEMVPSGFFARNPYELVMIDPETGRIVTRLKDVLELDVLQPNVFGMNSMRLFMAPPVVQGNVMFLTDEEKLLAIDLTRMEFLWKRILPEPTFSDSFLLKGQSYNGTPVRVYNDQNSPLVSGTRLLVKPYHSSRGVILNAKTGALISSPVMGKGAVAGNPDPGKGSVFVLSPTNAISAFDPNSGEKIASLQLDANGCRLIGNMEDGQRICVWTSDRIQTYDSKLHLVETILMPEGDLFPLTWGQGRIYAAPLGYGKSLIMEFCGARRVIPKENLTAVDQTDGASNENLSSRDHYSRNLLLHGQMIRHEKDLRIILSGAYENMYLVDSDSDCKNTKVVHLPGNLMQQARFHVGENVFYVISMVKKTIGVSWLDQDFRIRQVELGGGDSSNSVGRTPGRGNGGIRFHGQFSPGAGDVIYVLGESKGVSGIYQVNGDGTCFLQKKIPFPANCVKSVFDEGRRLLVFQQKVSVDYPPELLELVYSDAIKAWKIVKTYPMQNMADLSYHFYDTMCRVYRGEKYDVMLNSQPNILIVSKQEGTYRTTPLSIPPHSAQQMPWSVEMEGDRLCLSFFQQNQSLQSKVINLKTGKDFYGFDPRGVPVQRGDRLYGLQIKTVNNLPHVASLIYDVKTNHLLSEELIPELQKTEYQHANFTHVGSFQDGDTLYDIIQPLNFGPTQKGFLIERRGLEKPKVTKTPIVPYLNVFAQTGDDLYGVVCGEVFKNKCSELIAMLKGKQADDAARSVADAPADFVFSADGDLSEWDPKLFVKLNEDDSCAVVMTKENLLMAFQFRSKEALRFFSDRTNKCRIVLSAKVNFDIPNGVDPRKISFFTNNMTNIYPNQEVVSANPLTDTIVVEASISLRHSGRGNLTRIWRHWGAIWLNLQRITSVSSDNTLFTKGKKFKFPGVEPADGESR